MVWGQPAKESVFSMHDQGRLEKEIVKVAIQDHDANDKTVRRCITGLDWIKEGESTSGDLKDRFGRLGGTDHYLRELRREYRSYRHPPSVTRVTFEVKSRKRLDMVDQVLGQGDNGSTQVYVDLHLVTTRPVRLDGVAITVSGQRLDGHLILQEDRMRNTGKYLAVFNIPAELDFQNGEFDIVVYADGVEIQSENKETLVLD